MLCFAADFNVRAGTIRSHVFALPSQRGTPVRIVLLGHDDLPSLYALQRVIEGAPHHDYQVYLSGELAAAAESPHGLQNLADVDARLCAELRATGRLAEPLMDAATLPAPNSVTGRGILQGLEPDLVVSIRYRRILRSEVIAIPRLGVLNLHSGVLPEYKGVMATFWAMLQNESEIGATLHRIVDCGIDTGPVIGIRRISTDYESSYLANVLRLYGPGCTMVVDALQVLEAGREPAARPQPSGGRYFSAPAADDLDAFTGRGLTLASGLEGAEIAPIPGH